MGLPVIFAEHDCCCCCGDGDFLPGSRLRRVRRRVLRRRISREEAEEMAGEYFKVERNRTRSCRDFFQWLRGFGAEPGAVYEAMTQKPEAPEGVYLAQENSGRSANTNFCLRMGCTRWKDVPTSQSVEALSPINSPRTIGQRHIKFASQLSVAAPCGPPVQPSKQQIPTLLPPSAEGEVFIRFHCAQGAQFDRDCLGDGRLAPSYVEALQQGRAWAFRFPRFYEVFDREGGQLIARGTGY